MGKFVAPTGHNGAGSDARISWRKDCLPADENVRFREPDFILGGGGATNSTEALTVANNSRTPQSTNRRMTFKSWMGL